MRMKTRVSVLLALVLSLSSLAHAGFTSTVDNVNDGTTAFTIVNFWETDITIKAGINAWQLKGIYTESGTFGYQSPRHIQIVDAYSKGQLTGVRGDVNGTESAAITRMMESNTYLKGALQATPPTASRVGEPSCATNCYAAAVGTSLWVNDSQWLERLLEKDMVEEKAVTEASFAVHGSSSCSLGCSIQYPRSKISLDHASYGLNLEWQTTEGCNGKPVTIQVLKTVSGKYGFAGRYKAPLDVTEHVYSAGKTKFYKWK